MTCLDVDEGKIAAENEAFAIARRTGVAMTSIHPGLILGPRFWKPSESVNQIVQFVNQGAPVYFDGGFSVVDVEDVARGAVLAMEKGRNGERYILAGDNITVKQLFDTMAELTGLRAPGLKLPVPVLRVAAGAMELVSKLTGQRPMIDRSQVDEFGGKWAYFDCGKAKRELGYTHLSARETVRRTLAWIIERGMVSEKRRRALQPHPSLAAGVP